MANMLYSASDVTWFDDSSAKCTSCGCFMPRVGMFHVPACCDLYEYPWYWAYWTRILNVKDGRGSFSCNRATMVWVVGERPSTKKVIFSSSLCTLSQRYATKLISDAKYCSVCLISLRVPRNVVTASSITAGVTYVRSRD